MSETPRLKLPAIAAAQAQKHVTHNEALIKLDCLVDLHLQDRHLADPPEADDGMAYLVASGGTGAWAGQDHRIAYRIDGDWRFYSPFAGLGAYVVDESVMIVFSGQDWVDLSAMLDFQNLNQLGVNTSADATNRLAVKSDAILFAGRDTASGGTGGIQFKIVKDGAGDTASLLFQTNYSGRAELGLAGEDNLAIKVSPDGGTWHTALRADAATGRVSFPGGADGVPIGTVIWHAAQSPPPGFLICDGSAKSRAGFPRLFDVIGTTYGAGDGTTSFNMPDLRGEFIRGWDSGRNADPGRVFGTAQAGGIEPHTGSGGAQDTGGGRATRPRNLALLACIKY